MSLGGSLALSLSLLLPPTQQTLFIIAQIMSDETKKNLCQEKNIDILLLFSY
jgi:hypothetical protein